MEWEGPDAVEECSDIEPTIVRVELPQPVEAKREEEEEEPSELEPLSESEDDQSSEDDYVVEKGKQKGKAAPVGKVRSHQSALRAALTDT